MEKNYLTKNSSQTKKIGELLAKNLLNKGIKKRALVIGLEGDLGGGKTTFLQGFAKGLGIKEKILSPTFIIMRKFKIRDSKFKTFYHFDCYRIEKPKEILKLGFVKILSGPRNIVAIEWPEKVKKFLPRKIIWVNFQLISKNSRKLIIKE